MKRVYVNEEWCLGCHLCEFYCAYANSGEADIVKALKEKKLHPRIRVEGDNKVSFAVSCRHCDNAPCVKGCITGAITKKDGVVSINRDKCVGCYTCILVCPYGAVMPAGDGPVQKCELCTSNCHGTPVCVTHCINRAIVFESRDEAQ